MSDNTSEELTALDKEIDEILASMGGDKPKFEISKEDSEALDAIADSTSLW